MNTSDRPNAVFQISMCGEEKKKKCCKKFKKNGVNCKKCPKL